MDKNRKSGTSNMKKDHHKVPYSPTKDIVECERLNIERKIKTAEIEFRMKIYEKTMLRRRGDLNQDPSLNNVHFRRFEDNQMAEISKRRDEINIIDKEMTKIKRHIAESLDI